MLASISLRTYRRMSMEAMSTGFCVLAVYFPADSVTARRNRCVVSGSSARNAPAEVCRMALRIVSSTGGVQQDRGQACSALRIHVADLALQGAADVLGEHDGILFLGAPLDERFKDAPQVADGYLLLYQPLKDFRNTLRGQQAGGFADQIGARSSILSSRYLDSCIPRNDEACRASSSERW